MVAVNRRSTRASALLLAALLSATAFVSAVPVAAAQAVDHDSDGFAEDIDCDDNDRSVYPGAAEDDFNDVDDDCDGAIDEGPQPQLSMEGFSATRADLWLGETTTIWVLVHNSGHVAPGPYTVRFADATGHHDVRVTDQSSRSLSEITFELTPTAAGTYSYTVHIDVLDEVSEAYEGDNVGGPLTIRVYALDDDEDNWSPPEDCDDSDPAVHPGAADDTNDDIDNDCDGTADEDAPAVDNDGDTFTADIDCDDNNGSVYPGAHEDDSNDIDDDCDDAINEGPQAQLSEMAFGAEATTVRLGETTSMYVGVQNAGDGPAGAYTIRFAHATGYHDVRVAGQSSLSMRTVFFELTPTAPGTYSYTVHIDVFDEISEAYEGDNVGGPITIRVYVDEDEDGWEPPEDCNDTDPGVNPDGLEIRGNDVDEDCDGTAEAGPQAQLKIYSLDAFPDTITLGESARITVYFDNHDGKVEAGPFTIRFEHATGHYDVLVARSPAGSAPEPEGIDFTPSAAGTYTFTARIDVFDEVAESNEADNAAGPLTITVQAVDEDGDAWSPPEDCDDNDPDVHPDATEVPGNDVDEDCDGTADETALAQLRLGAITLDSEPRQGAGTLVRVLIYNDGPADAGEFHARFMAEGASNADLDVFIHGVAAGGAVQAVAGWVPAAQGVHNLEFIADRYGVIAESDKSDNAATPLLVTVGPCACGGGGTGGAAGPSAPPFSASLHVSGDGMSDTTFFGIDEAATFGFDKGLDSAAPPAPPRATWVRAFFSYPENEGATDQLRGSFHPRTLEQEWVLVVQARGEAGSVMPVQLAWDTEHLEPLGEAFALYLVHGDTTIDMEQTGVYSFAMPGTGAGRSTTLRLVLQALAPDLGLEIEHIDGYGDGASILEGHPVGFTVDVLNSGRRDATQAFVDLLVDDELIGSVEVGALPIGVAEQRTLWWTPLDVRGDHLVTLALRDVTPLELPDTRDNDSVDLLVHVLDAEVAIDGDVEEVTFRGTGPESIDVTLLNLGKVADTVELEWDAPEGWLVEPASPGLELAPGEAGALEVLITPPARAMPGEIVFRARSLLDPAEVSADPYVLLLDTLERATLALAAGWNMVSIPLDVGLADVEDVFPGIGGIWAYDATARSYVEPTHVEAGVGYWVYVAEATQLQVAGLPLPSVLLEGLGDGWHMIAGPSSSAVVERASESGAFENVAYTWDGGLGNYVDVEPPAVQPGRGYWLLVSSGPVDLEMVGSEAGEQP